MGQSDRRGPTPLWQSVVAKARGAKTFDAASLEAMVFGLFCKKAKSALPENLRDAFGAALSKDKPILVWVMRRFGCPLCRGIAVKLRDQVQPTLEAKGVQMIAVGLEMLGLEEFQKGKFWTGDLVVEKPEQELHKLLNTKKMGMMEALLPHRFYGMIKEGKAMQKDVGGDLEGDGFTLGGAWLLNKDGKCIYEYRQKHFTHHPDMDDILKAAESL